ncbi:MAG: NADH-quinone oxidoreductase subunit NuoE [Deltaproteobacteria bacterium]|nr:NADH-quinone oxidoreductase subunit NuoE [Candidatus Zymogenaceae bacterium]
MHTINEVKQATEFVTRIISAYSARPESLISILQDIQTQYRYLPEDILRQVATELGLPLIQVYGVATFFRAFSLTPRGKHSISVCLGTACHVRGGRSVMEEMERQLGIKNGETTPDMLFTLESVNCLGACALGPVVVIDGSYHGKVSSGKIKKLLAEYSKETSRSKK